VLVVHKVIRGDVGKVSIDVFTGLLPTNAKAIH
jgi:hypothetical protein